MGFYLSIWQREQKRKGWEQLEHGKGKNKYLIFTWEKLQVHAHVIIFSIPVAKGTSGNPERFKKVYLYFYFNHITMF